MSGFMYCQVVTSTVARYPDLQADILANHDYDVPEVLTLPVLDGNPAYLAWLSEEAVDTA